MATAILKAHRDGMSQQNVCVHRYTIYVYCLLKQASKIASKPKPTKSPEKKTTPKRQMFDPLTFENYKDIEAADQHDEIQRHFRSLARWTPQMCSGSMIHRMGGVAFVKVCLVLVDSKNFWFLKIFFWGVGWIWVNKWSWKMMKSW